MLYIETYLSKNIYIYICIYIYTHTPNLYLPIVMIVRASTSWGVNALCRREFPDKMANLKDSALR